MPPTLCVTTKKPLFNKNVDAFLVKEGVVMVYLYSFIIYLYSFLTPIFFLFSA